MTISYGLCWDIDSRKIIWPARAHFGAENESLKGLREPHNLYLYFTRLTIYTYILHASRSILIFYTPHDLYLYFTRLTIYTYILHASRSILPLLHNNQLNIRERREHRLLLRLAYTRCSTRETRETAQLHVACGNPVRRRYCMGLPAFWWAAFPLAASFEPLSV